ncbi:DUF3017 domain-containing protein [uncultured Jatrophihabitans sp.]|uniref:DUF3017 domain-containing protein n=1 Tax=uncultured Jatrophihabitans sp. TaxID=1610747 RepID=UPI0035CC368E
MTVVGRTWRWVREQLAFLIVLAGLAAGFCYLVAEPDHPVRGTLAISVVALGAAVLRLVLPGAAVGMLAVRGRWIDTACFLVFGGLILATDIRLRH